LIPGVNTSRARINKSVWRCYSCEREAVKELDRLKAAAAKRLGLRETKVAGKGWLALPASTRRAEIAKQREIGITSGIVSVAKRTPLFFIKSPVLVVTPELARIREEIKAERAKQAKKDNKVIDRRGHLYIVTSLINEVGSRHILGLGEDHRLVKVGHAMDPYQRIRSPQTFNCMADLTVVSTVYFEDRYAAEAATHDLMEAWLFDREWFAMTVEEAKRIIEYVQRDHK
jgi:hypothetical protein